MGGAINVLRETVGLCASGVLSLRQHAWNLEGCEASAKCHASLFPEVRFSSAISGSLGGDARWLVPLRKLRFCAFCGLEEEVVR